MLVSGSLSPVFDGCPVHFEDLIAGHLIVKCLLDAGSSQELFKVMAVAVIDESLVWEIVFLDLLCNAGLQSTLYRVAGEVVCSSEVASAKQCLSLGNAKVR